MSALSIVVSPLTYPLSCQDGTYQNSALGLGLGLLQAQKAAPNGAVLGPTGDL
jgi:hypothetical protein